MPSFQYRASDQAGRATTGELSCFVEGRSEIAEQTLRLGHIFVNIRSKQKKVKAKEGTTADCADRWMRRISNEMSPYTSTANKP